MSQVADVRGTWNSDTLKISWTTDIGISGEATLPRSKATAASELAAVEKSWSDFKEYVAELESGNFLFRGQNKPWRLRTSFHRAGRADVLRFMREDVPSLHRNLSARAKHVFNLDIPNENGAFLNLIQHHGYPTPLLDWTYSPYVAAFFAYRGISNEEADNAPATSKVRVLVLDQRQCLMDTVRTTATQNDHFRRSYCQRAVNNPGTSAISRGVSRLTFAPVHQVPFSFRSLLLQRRRSFRLRKSPEI
jgi:hypothetical protein